MYYVKDDFDELCKAIEENEMRFALAKGSSVFDILAQKTAMDEEVGFYTTTGHKTECYLIPLLYSAELNKEEKPEYKSKNILSNRTCAIYELFERYSICEHNLHKDTVPFDCTEFMIFLKGIGFFSADFIIFSNMPSKPSNYF